VFMSECVRSGEFVVGHVAYVGASYGVSMCGVYVLVALERSLLGVVHTLVDRMEVLVCGMCVLMALVQGLVE
jgi:hypothetical protein